MKNPNASRSFGKSFRRALLTIGTALSVSLASALNSETNANRSGEIDTTRTPSNLTTRDSEIASINALSHSDRHFLEKAAQGEQNELRLAQLASNRSDDPRVKSFAEKLLADHQKMNAELTHIAMSKGVLLTSSEREDRHLKYLSDKPGPEFDKRFVGHIIDDHDDTITLFEKAANSNDADVAAFASKALVGLEEHLRQGKELEASLKR